ncbi:MAG: hypothetical protein ILP12_03980 [Lachnospiraceae bacterium]|nr:hypothetical protein [Lachnospiraceae bacterium]
MTQTIKNNGGSTLSSVTYTYAYDALRNIVTISEGSTFGVGRKTDSGCMMVIWVEKGGDNAK